MRLVSYTVTPPSAPPVRIEAEQLPDGNWAVTYADGSTATLTPEQIKLFGFLPDEGE